MNVGGIWLTERLWKRKEEYEHWGNKSDKL